MRVRIVCNFNTFRFGDVRRLEIEPKRVRLETSNEQVTELPFDHAYGLAAVVVFEERSTHEPHAWGDHQGLARSHGAEGLA